MGGPGTGACSGDLLLGALAACAQLTGQMVADGHGRSRRAPGGGRRGRPGPPRARWGWTARWAPASTPSASASRSTRRRRRREQLRGAARQDRALLHGPPDAPATARRRDRAGRGPLASRRDESDSGRLDRVRRGQDAVRRARAHAGRLGRALRAGRQLLLRRAGGRPGGRRLRRRGVRACSTPAASTPRTSSASPGGRTFFWAGEYEYNLNIRHTLETQLNVFGDFRPKLSEASRGADVRLPREHPARPPARGARAVRPARGSSRMDSMNLWIDTAARLADRRRWARSTA